MATTHSPSVLTVPLAEAAPVVLNSTTTIAAYVRQVQNNYGLGDDFYETLRIESDGFQNIQSEVKNPKGPNGREDSWCIAQIHLPSHPEITREQACDPKWAVDWSAKEFLAGRQKQWTVWRNAYGSVSR